MENCKPELIVSTMTKAEKHHRLIWRNKARRSAGMAALWRPNDHNGNTCFGAE
jgi:hypothetical protein